MPPKKKTTMRRFLFKVTNIPKSGIQVVCLQLQKKTAAKALEYAKNVEKHWFVKEKVFSSHDKEGKAILDEHRYQFPEFFERQLKSQWGKEMERR